MAGANLQIVVQAKDQASSVIAGISKPLAGLVSGLGAIGLASIGLDSIGGAMKDFIGNAMESQAVQSQLNAVLKSTHGVAGMTADSVNDLANSLSKITPFDDEAIGSAENLLLTFTNVGKNVFPEATGAILDMSQALGQDLQSSTIQLGKALNDPIKGITALSRVGVSFTEGQKKMIEQLVKAGKTEQAQKVILKELATEFGGAAKAAGQTFTGKMAILETQIGNVKEAIGGPLITVLSDLMTKVTPLISEFADALPGAIQSAAGAVKTFLQPLSALGSIIGDTIASGDVIQGVSDFSGLIADAFGIDAANAFLGFTQGVEDMGGAVLSFIPKLEQFGAGIVAAVKGLVGGSGIEQALADINDYFVEAFNVSPAEVLSNLEGLGLSVIQWVKDEAGKIRDQALAWGQAFLDWAKPIAAQIPGEADAIFQSVKTWIADQIPKIRTQAQTWAAGFTGWVKDIAPKIPGELDAIVASIKTWVTDQIPIIQAQLETWAISFRAWIGPAAKVLNDELDVIGSVLLGWIDAQIPKLNAQLATWKDSFLVAVAPVSGAFSALVGVLTAAAVAYGLLTAQATATAIALGVQTLATNLAAIAQAALNLVMTANPIGIVIVALAGLGAALFALYETNTGFRNIVDSTFKAVKDAIGTAVDFAVGQFNTFKRTIDDLIASINRVMSAINNIPASIHLPSIPNISLPNPLGGGSGAGSSYNSQNVTVNLNAPNTNPAGAAAGAHAGVLAAHRALGY